MLVDKSTKLEEEVLDLGMEVVAVLKKAKAGETPTQILGEELAKLGQLFKDVSALKADVEESFLGTIRAAALVGAEVLAVILNKDAEPL